GSDHVPVARRARTARHLSPAPDRPAADRGRVRNVLLRPRDLEVRQRLHPPAARFLELLLSRRAAVAVSRSRADEPGDAGRRTGGLRALARAIPLFRDRALP